MVPNEVREILSSNKPDIDNVRWLKPEKYHITFEYFAELPDKTIDEVQSKVIELTTYFPLQCEAQCFSGFPSNREARVIIARLALTNFQISKVCDNERFNPHVTVGYARKLPVVVPQNSLQHSFSFSRPALFRSERGIYTEISADRH